LRVRTAAGGSHASRYKPVAPVLAVQVRLTCVSPGVAVRLVGAAGGRGSGVRGGLRQSSHSRLRRRATRPRSSTPCQFVTEESVYPSRRAAASCASCVYGAAAGGRTLHVIARCARAGCPGEVTTALPGVAVRLAGGASTTAAGLLVRGGKQPASTARHTAAMRPQNAILLGGCSIILHAPDHRGGWL